MKRVRIRIAGRVQGVGFRDWMIEEGRRLGLEGWVRNRADGSVEALVAGDDPAVEAMIGACRRGPAAARVRDVDVQAVDETPPIEGFTRRPTV
jgi:acylphosphatase